MLDKILAGLSVALLAAFLAVLVFFVTEPDLIVVTVIVIAIAVYDLWTTFRGGKESGNAGKE